MKHNKLTAAQWESVKANLGPEFITMNTTQQQDKTPTKPAQGHTPGPWKSERVSQRYGCYGHEIQPPYRGAMTMRSAPIAQINSDDEEDRANARLIAAAPDLLAACKALLGMDNPPAANPAHIDFARAVAMGQAAIAKAEGRAE